MSTDLKMEPASTEEQQPANAIAWAGIAFGLVAAVLYGILFYLLSRLPSSRSELSALRTNAPALTRLLIVGASAGLLNLVALILCLTGCLLPRRSRFEARAGTVISGIMFVAVFSVVAASLLLVP